MKKLRNASRNAHDCKLSSISVVELQCGEAKGLGISIILPLDMVALLFLRFPGSDRES